MLLSLKNLAVTKASFVALFVCVLQQPWCVWTTSAWRQCGCVRQATGPAMTVTVSMTPPSVTALTTARMQVTSITATGVSARAVYFVCFLLGRVVETSTLFVSVGWVHVLSTLCSFCKVNGRDLYAVRFCWVSCLHCVRCARVTSPAEYRVAVDQSNII